MKTRIEKANGLWWRLLATLSVVAILLMVNTNAMAQDKNAAKDKVYEKAEVMPEFPGGMEAMIKYMQENITVPEKYIDKGVKAEYRVLVRFVVETDGSVNEVETVKPEPSKQDLNEEAVRVVKGMPKWTPGKDKGKAVRVSYMLPITFKLQ